MIDRLLRQESAMREVLMPILEVKIRRKDEDVPRRDHSVVNDIEIVFLDRDIGLERDESVDSPSSLTSA